MIEALIISAALVLCAPRDAALYRLTAKLRDWHNMRKKRV